MFPEEFPAQTQNSLEEVPDPIPYDSLEECPDPTQNSLGEVPDPIPYDSQEEFTYPTQYDSIYEGFHHRSWTDLPFRTGRFAS